MVTVDQTTQYTFNGKTYKQQHGNAFDRGSADSYYGRPRDPHCWPEGTYKGKRVDLKPGTEAYEAYMAGYDYNEQHGDKKDWG
jgi:hypothetical protein